MKLFKTLSHSLIAFSIAVIGGCSVTPKEPPPGLISNRNLKSFEASGKMGFSNGERGGNATVRWEQNGTNYAIRVYGPFGAGAIQIAGNHGQVQLTRADGKVRLASSPEALVQQEMGWTIPVSGLRYWLQGIAAPGAPPTQTQRDSAKRISFIQQQGWSVQYQNYQEVQGQAVPYKMLLQNGPIRLKFIFNNWVLR